MKNIDKKRKVQLFIIFMIVIALLAGSVTYALIELNRFNKYKKVLLKRKSN